LIFKCESNFKRSGGKGVATALGTLFALNPSVGYICIFLWGGGYIMTRTFGISAVLSFFTLPIVLYYLDLGSFGLKIYAIILSVIIISTHIGNIRRYFKF
ncbi:MAG: glycerol-3-phosphate acyltransferase, partial [Proteobacteria bacterium]|nr:glycerol-3-phosphate acyltransferase [Pseudomonadota bacterium]